jgi:nicotinamide riboside kinase
LIPDCPIIIEGAHNAGKTTLAQRLSENLSVPYYNEIARTVLRDRGITADFTGLSVETICEIQSEMIAAFYKQVQSGEPCVIDRGCVSVYAYSLEWLARSDAEVAFDTLESARDAVQQQAGLKSINLLLPPNIPIESDGLRETNPYVRNRIHYVISGILDTYGFEVGRVQSDDKDIRLHEALTFIHQSLAYSATKGGF